MNVLKKIELKKVKGILEKEEMKNIIGRAGDYCVVTCKINDLYTACENTSDRCELSTNPLSGGGVYFGTCTFTAKASDNSYSAYCDCKASS